MKNTPQHPALCGFLTVGLLAGCASQGTARADAGTAETGASARTPAGAQTRSGTTGSGATRDVLGAPLTSIEASELREKSIAILEQAAFNPWALLRANAIEGLQAAPARAEPIVRAGLADENIGVRFAAAMTVGQLEIHALRIQVAGLANDPDPCVVAASIYARARLGESPDPTPLANMLMYGDARTRANAAFILGELGDRSAAPMLRDAANRLSAPGGDLAIGPAASRLLRLHVASALVKLGDTQMIQTIRAALYPSVVEEMEDAVLAAQLLGELKDEGSIAQLVKIVEYRVTGRDDRRSFDGDAFLYPIELRLAAATTLAKLGQPDGVFVGLMSQTSPEPEVRAQITFLYAAVGGPPAARKLAVMLDDPDPQVRVAASANLIRTLGKRGVVGPGR